MSHNTIKYYIGRAFVKTLNLKGFSYSHLNEDNIIDWLTGYKEKGVYIDIGANNPDMISNTKLFYKRGWRGINIEPSEKEFALLQKQRPEDKNYNCGIGNGEMSYFEGDGTDNSGNTTNEKIAKIRGMNTKRKIILKPLSEIFKENNLTKVDFLSMDIEGSENEALRSNDWNKYKANVLCIEGSGYARYLKGFGYKPVFWDGANTYYKLRKE